jgi:hypothetical protein
VYKDPLGQALDVLALNGGDERQAKDTSQGQGIKATSIHKLKMDEIRLMRLDNSYHPEQARREQDGKRDRGTQASAKDAEGHTMNWNVIDRFVRFGGR